MDGWEASTEVRVLVVDSVEGYEKNYWYVLLCELCSVIPWVFRVEGEERWHRQSIRLDDAALSAVRGGERTREVDCEITPGEGFSSLGPKYDV